MQSSGISSPANISTTTTSSGQTRSRFALTGRSAHIDSRIDAARRDLADVRLADRVFAPHYASPVAHTVRTRSALYADKQCSEILSECLIGERFDVLEMVGGVCWGINSVDGAVGYISRNQIDRFSKQSAIVAALQASVRATPMPDSEIIGTIPMGSHVASPDATGWSEVGTGYVSADDILDHDVHRESDFVAIAERLIGVSYTEGGRSGAGVSPDGLIFLALYMAGISAPRFTDIQATSLDEAVHQDSQRGDLIYFDRHAAILADADTAIHCDPVKGAVVREPISALSAENRFGPVIAKRRVTA